MRAEPRWSPTNGSVEACLPGHLAVFARGGVTDVGGLAEVGVKVVDGHRTVVSGSSTQTLTSSDLVSLSQEDKVLL